MIKSKEEVAEILAAAEAATPGPWDNDVCAVEDDVMYAASGPVHPVADLEQAETDAAFIARARTDVPQLVESHEDLRALYNNLRNAIQTAFDELSEYRAFHQKPPGEDTPFDNGAWHAFDEGCDQLKYILNNLEAKSDSERDAKGGEE